MRTFCIILTVLLATPVAFCAEMNALGFFVVGETPIADGRNIDTPDFPKLGYVSNAPSFLLTRLQEVSTSDMTSISIMDRKVVSTNTSPAVVIRMFRTDGERFAEFTRQNIDRKLLLVSRDRSLLAPTVRAPIETGSIQLPSLPKSIVEDIQKLVRHE